MAISLFSHNYEAYCSACLMLESSGKAAIVHPTGTGKSFIGFKLCEDHPNELICWLSPSEYIFKTQLENLKDASGGFKPDNIVFYTYAKLMLMSAEEISEIKPDYIILDEFHRCGAEFWGQGVQNLLSTFPDTPILGLSATNIRYLDNQRNMADELFDGNIASEMTLGEAIVRGILNPPKYVLSVFSYQKDLERYQKRVYNTQNRFVRRDAEKYLEALRRSLEKADGLDIIFDKHMTDRIGKYILFCASKEHMDEMISHVPDWFGKIDNAPHIYTAYSNDPATSKAFADFKADSSEHLKLLFCIDMLNEGIHVDDIAGVILFRPTVSPIVYKQQIGRAMSASKRSDVVIFDIVNNFSSLYSIGSIQEEISKAVEYFRFNGENELIVNETFKVIDEVRDCIRLFDEMENVLTASWDYMYRLAADYYRKNGNLDIPVTYVTENGEKLGCWYRQCVSENRKGTLTAERKARLLEIGFEEESINVRTWMKHYAEAKKYANRHGNLNIHADYETESGLKLGTWISSQRYSYNLGRLPENRISLLEAIGIDWQRFDAKWMLGFSHLEEYVREFGNAEVPYSFICSDGFKLGSWTSSQRSRKQVGKLSDEKIQKMEALGCVWNVPDTAWEDSFSAFKEFVNKYGQTDIPSDYMTPHGTNLKTWLLNQRSRFASKKMEDWKIKKLDSVDPTWNKHRDNWDAMFECALQYVKEHGSLSSIPTDYISDIGINLYSWIMTQRKSIKAGKLSSERIEKLCSIGFSPDPSEDAWNKGYEYAVAFYNSNGHLKPSTGYDSDNGFDLYQWLRTQRRAYKNEKISQDRKTKLDALGMSWQIKNK